MNFSLHINEISYCTQASAGNEAALARLNMCLESLFRHPDILKLGFKAAPDFERLACSYPALSCFRRINNVLDTCTLAQHALPSLIKTRRLRASVLYGVPLKGLGLSKLTSIVTGRRGLDKTQQCSAWHLRPLTPEQVTCRICVGVCASFHSVCTVRPRLHMGTVLCCHLYGRLTDNVVLKIPVARSTV
jgi:hypothetical protein